MLRRLLMAIFLFAAPALAQTTAIRAGNLIDPATGAVTKNQIILIKDGKIAEVGASVKIPAGAVVVDLSNSWVLPGLMDAHTHLTLGSPGELSLEGEYLKSSSALRALNGLRNAQNVLEAMRVNGVRRIFYTSGSGVYGERPDVAFAEDYGPCLPISTYGASKLACEALICSYCHMFGLIGRVFRFANVVGPRQTHGVGYDFVRRLRSDSSELRILGDGSQCKSYIHVDDILAAMFLVRDSVGDGVPFDVFNVATDEYVTVNAIADIAVRESGLVLASVRYRHTGGDRGWKGDVPKVRFNVQKIKALGWRCGRTSAEAIRDSLRAMIIELDAHDSRPQ